MKSQFVTEQRSQLFIKPFEDDYLLSDNPIHTNGNYNDLITCCPLCQKIIKGYGAMRSHVRYKHLPKFYGQAYCILHKHRMSYYPNRKYYFCAFFKPLLITNDGKVLKKHDKRYEKRRIKELSKIQNLRRKQPMLDDVI